MKEIVIVGAGPVGLWTAIQLKKRNPENCITIYERYEKYQRSHVLRLDHWSMMLYGKTKRDDIETSFINEVTGKSRQHMKMEFTKSLYIKTNDFEQALKNYCKNLGINIIIQKINSITEVENMHPSCSHFIASDGAHSLLRNELLGNESIDTKPLQHVVELKFHVPHKTKKSKNLKELIGLNIENKFMNFEYVGKFKNGETPLTSRFFLSSLLYDKLPEASFKEPLSFKILDTIEELHEFRDNLLHYINYRKKEYNDEIDIETVKISKLILSVYSAKKFAVLNKEENKCWFLTGDAAMGVPYFRALNSGMMLSSRLSQIINSSITTVGNEVKNQASLYNFHQPLHIQTEFSIAFGKNFLLNSFNEVRQLPKKLKIT